jgi:uncharacterized membrane protein YdbT with pleckstrin-like domain
VNGEQDVWSARPSLWIGFRTYFWAVILCMVFLFIGLVERRALFGVGIAAIIVAIRILQIKKIHYHLTSQRLRITSGILSRHLIEVELFRVRDLSMQQGFIQRLLSIGTVRAVSTDQDADDIFLRGIKDAMKVKENLRRFVMETRMATGTRDLDVAAIGRK